MPRAEDGTTGRAGASPCSLSWSFELNLQTDDDKRHPSWRKKQHHPAGVVRLKRLLERCATRARAGVGSTCAVVAHTQKSVCHAGCAVRTSVRGGTGATYPHVQPARPHGFGGFRPTPKTLAWCRGKSPEPLGAGRWAGQHGTGITVVVLLFKTRHEIWDDGYTSTGARESKILVKWCEAQVWWEPVTPARRKDEPAPRC